MQLDRQEVLASIKTSDTTGRKNLPQEAIDADHVVVMTAKFVPWKGVDKLIQAAAGVDPHASDEGKKFDGVESSLGENGKNVVTLIAGTNADDPDYVAAMEALPEQLGAKNIFFLGHVVPETLAQLNAIADVGVYPSDNEPFGMVAIEAMAQGLPVLVGTGGFRNFVDADVGEYIDPHSPVDIAQKITIALEQKWRKAKSEQSIARASDFSWVKQFGKYHEVYEQVHKWTRGGHPKGVYKPSRVLYDLPIPSPLRRALFSPYKVAMDMVRLVPEEHHDIAASAALFIKLGLRHGHLNVDDAKARLRNGEHKKTFERIAASARRG